ncbi:MAG: hypothetical protein V4670_12240 [Bacteroidota bacterium]
MGLIKIIALDGTEIDFVKNSLTVKKENNAFSTEFKVSYSSFPFLIIENAKTKLALGNRDITSLNKKKVIDVIIEEAGVIYYGQIQQLSFLNGFRKANLKYSSQILNILNKKLSEFMPIVSIIPDETDPIPFTELSEDIIPGYENWPSYANSFLDKCFPDVKWQFPMMYWKNKFGINLDADHDWFKYKQHINNYFEGNLIENTFIVDGSDITVSNENVISPQVFLLSPLYYAAESINYKITGDVVDSEFFKRLLLLSTKNNICQTFAKAESEPFEITMTDFVADLLFGTFVAPQSGTYIVTWSFTIPPVADISIGTNCSLEVYTAADFFFGFAVHSSTTNLTFSGVSEIDCLISEPIVFYYKNKEENIFIDHSITILNSDGKKVYQEMHPTIQTGRYVPDITFATYLNELKKLFNLKIDIDDHNKELVLNFNENQLFNKPTILNRSLNLDSYDIVANTSFILKYANDTDLGIFVTINDFELLIEQKDDFNKPISFGFKQVPNNGYTANLSADVEKKQGIGLMIYNPESLPYISPDYLGQTLNINGDGGIYDVYFKKWLKFRLSASGVDLSGSFTKTEANILSKSEDIYIDKQHYKIVSLEISEESETFFLVKLKLESVNL